MRKVFYVSAFLSILLLGLSVSEVSAQKVSESRSIGAKVKSGARLPEEAKARLVAINITTSRFG